MRIVLVSHYALPHLGGIEVAVDGLARALAARGHEVVHVASSAVRGDEPREAVGGSYERLLVPAFNGIERRTGLPYPLFSPRLAGALRARSRSADIVHAHGYLYVSSAAAMAAARAAPARPVRVVTEHVAQVPYDDPVVAALQRAGAATVGRAVLRAAEGVVVLNAGVEREALRLAPGRPRRLIANGVDDSQFRPAAPGERERLRAQLGWDGAPRALFVGRLVEKKGADVILAAAESLPDMRFALVGPGDPPRAASPNVEVLGAVSRSRVAELYRAADAFVLPSRGEGFPVTAQEAMSSGLPVLLGRDPAYAPLLRGAGPGVTQVAPEPAAVAAELSALLGEPGRRERAVAAAIEHARRAFSWRRAAEEHEALYRELRVRRGTGHDR